MFATFKIAFQFYNLASIFTIHLNLIAMEEQFVLRVPPAVAERIERLLGENTSTSDDKSLDLSFTGEYMHIFW